ncbi:MAG: Ig-like domain-containing protein [Verrucomicrobiae bacterium]|nr:Ig-like domain-containing protein [Verrucomicrobiae bacterium]
MHSIRRGVASGFPWCVLGLFFCLNGPIQGHGQAAAGAGPRLSIRALDAFDFRLSWPAEPAGFGVEEAASLLPPIAWTPVSATPAVEAGEMTVRLAFGPQARFFRLRTMTAPLTTIASTSPARGESGVAVTRETVVRFSAPLAASAQITTDQFHAEFGGRRILGRVEIGGDRRTATLFHLEPLPGSARIRVTLMGEGLTDGLGRPLDANGDGEPGGTAVFDFTTLSLSSVPNTAVTGRVLASETGLGPDGQPINRPLAGAIVTLDGREQSVRATTEEDGSFILSPVPAGEFFVHIDGRTAEGSAYPNGSFYPSVGKSWTAVAGRTNLAGGTGEVYLPRIIAGTLQPVSMTADTEIAFPAETLREHPELAGVTVTVPANALFADDGRRGGLAGIAPVPSDRLPGLLPVGLGFPLVITIQTDGALNFDRPAPVRFPNLPDPVTGEVLPPGAKTGLWSFNHDTGRWELQGSMTISADGRLAVSDPGVGVTAPGWHGTNPNTEGGGGGGGGPRNPRDPRDPDDPDDPDDDPVDPCDLERKKLLLSDGQCALSLLSAIPVFGCGVSFFAGGVSAAADCAVDYDSCGGSVLGNVATSLIGCVPVIGGATSASMTCLFGRENAYVRYRLCRDAPRSVLALHGLDPRPSVVVPPGAIPSGLLFEQARLWSDSADFFAALYGSSKWSVIPPEGAVAAHAILGAVRQASQISSPAGVRISPEERDAIVAMPRPPGIAMSDVLAVIDRKDRMNAGLLTPAELNLPAIRETAETLLQTALTLEARGWETTLDYFEHALKLADDQDAAFHGHRSAGGRAALASPSPTSARPYELRPSVFYKITNTQNGFAQRGRLGPNGEFNSLILVAEAIYLVQYADPHSLETAVTVFRAARAGNFTTIPRAIFSPEDSADSDGDGLPDDLEDVLGTNPANPDTDGDGIPDGVEVRNGTDPLDGLPMATGVLASVDTPGTAMDLGIGNQLAVVADQSQGIAVIDISNPLSPLHLAQVPFERSVQLVAVSGPTALVGLPTQVAVVDLSAPASPRVTHRFDTFFTVTAVGVRGVYGYAGLQNGWVRKYDLRTGAMLWEWTGDGRPVDQVTATRGMIFVLTRNALHILSDAPGPPTPIGTVAVPGDIPVLVPGRPLFVGDDHAVVGHNRGYAIIDIRDPTAPVVVGAADETQLSVWNLASTGSGMMLAATAPWGVGATALRLTLYDATDPGVAGQVLTTFDTPGDSRKPVLHNGLALIADSGAGLQVFNYLPADLAGVPPSVSLHPIFDPAGPEGDSVEPIWVSVRATDDVQVRDVELYLDGERIQVDGTYPFEFGFLAPLRSATRSEFTLRARATDTGGAFAWSDPLIVPALVDRVPPTVRAVHPATNAVVRSGTLSRLWATVSEPLDPATVNASTFRLFEAGPDGNPNTADDLAIAGAVGFEAATRTAFLQTALPLPQGSYTAVLSAGLADRSGNTLPQEVRWSFQARDTNTWIAATGGNWNVAANWSMGAIRAGDDLVIDVPDAEITTQVTTGFFPVRSLLSQERFTFQGGRIGVSDEAILNGLFVWSSGSFEGTRGIVRARGGLRMEGTSSRSIHTLTVVNEGPALWTGGGLTLFQEAGFQNGASGMLEIVNSEFLAMATSSDTALGFQNRGTVVKRGTGLVRFGGMAFRNPGQLDIEEGGIEFFETRFAGTGQVRVRMGATWSIAASVPAMAGWPRIEGGLTLDEGGVLSVSGSRFVAEPGSRIAGAGQVLVRGGGFTGFTASEIDVHGAYDVGSTTVEARSKARFHGDARTVELLLKDAGTELGGMGTVEVTDRIVWTGGDMAGGGTTRILGTLEIDAVNALSLNHRTLEILGTVTTRGPQPFSLFPGRRAHIDVLPGAIWRHGDGFRIAANPVSDDFRFTNAGSFLQEGDGESRVDLHVVNEGLFAVAAGRLTVGGTFQQTADGTLALEILAPPAEPASAGRLAVIRSVTLAGQLEIRRPGNFVPVVGAIYPVLTGASRAGEFESLTGLDIAPDRRFEIEYTATGLELHVRPRP